jgi:hypothetical protein
MYVCLRCRAANDSSSSCNLTYASLDIMSSIFLHETRACHRREATGTHTPEQVVLLDEPYMYGSRGADQSAYDRHSKQHKLCKMLIGRYR